VKSCTRPQALSLLLLAIVVGLTSCGLVGGDSNPEHHSAVVATEPQCIMNEPCQQATIAVTEEEIAAALKRWGYAPGTVVANGSVFVIFGFTESGSCPNEVADFEVTDDGLLDIEIPVIRSACTSDENERSYILELDAGTAISSVRAGRTDLELTR
jgi:hypothetical protein